MHRAPHELRQTTDRATDRVTDRVTDHTTDRTTNQGAGRVTNQVAVLHKLYLEERKDF